MGANMYSLNTLLVSILTIPLAPVAFGTNLAQVDVAIGPGNTAAVGVRMRGAQGSSIEDVTVSAAADVFAGIEGVSGSGGAHSNITGDCSTLSWGAVV